MSHWQFWLGIIAPSIATVGGAMAVIRHIIKGYLHELIPNSGKSLKDQVNRLEARVDEIYRHLLEGKK